MLVACYTVFNGLELLKDSINNIKDVVDEVIIAWSDVSHNGHKCNEVANFVRSLDVKSYKFTPNLRKHAKEIEKDKHLFLARKASELGASYVLLMATDHFYLKDDVEKAKAFLKANPKINATATPMYTYFKEPTFRLEPIEKYFMPFICRVPTRIVRKFPVKVDPACAFYPNKPFHLFKDIYLHHFSWLRLDIESKLKNAASRCNWKQKEEQFIELYNNFTIDVGEFPYYPNHKIVECENQFNFSNFYNSKNLLF